jgi:hypothetical protein
MTYLAWPAARFDEFRRDVEGNFLRTLDTVGLGERIRAGRRAERFRGTPDLPSYLRQPYGPGWALVGDAGLLMDPVTGQGISHAFRDAELLADAVADGLGGIRPLAEALRGYHRARDVPPGRCTTSPPGWPRSARPRLPRWRLPGARAPPGGRRTCPSGAPRASVPLRQFGVAAHHGAPWSACAGSPGWRSARRGRTTPTRSRMVRPPRAVSLRSRQRQRVS